MKSDTIILIGMPASGKSTAGVILAKIRGMNFIDTDLVIQAREGRRLSEIIAEKGLDEFIRIEGESVCSIHPEHAVVATGGSVIYNEAAMHYLSDCGTIVYLRVAKEALLKRLDDIEKRGVVLHEGESLDDMYDHRQPLYERYADIVVDETGFSLEDTVREIIRRIE